MSSRRRWLQFSLRGFLVVLTIGCLWLGWKVEKARRRGRAIDAVMAAGGRAFYRNSTAIQTRDNHFWLDLVGDRLAIFLRRPLTLNKTLGSHLSDIYGIDRLHVDVNSDSDLRYLKGLQHPKSVTCFYFDQSVTPEGLLNLSEMLPSTTISTYKWGGREGFEVFRLRP